MSSDDERTSDAADDNEPLVRGRKRVVAREVMGEVEAENRAAARLAPDDLDDVVEGEVVSRTEIVLPPGNGRGSPRAAVVIAEPDDEIRIPQGGGELREPAGDTLPVVDPTILGSRRRRTSHQRLYRWTQLLVLLCAGLAGAGVICTMFDDPLVGRWLAGAAALPGLIAWKISGGSELARRWRGWAVAATVFAGAAVGLTFVHEKLVGDEPGEGTPVKVTGKK